MALILRPEPHASAAGLAKSITCNMCGAPITTSSFVCDGETYCCEGCFLQREEFRVARIAHDGAIYLVLAEALAEALDAREHETGLHSKRVACHTLVLARRFTADEALLQQVYWGALLHDVGKIGIPDAVLLKQGPLDAGEWQTMRTHPEIGHRILSSVTFMATAAEIVLTHEERYDGTGYPNGLHGEEIPLWARLFALIDTLDAITSDRPYRKGVTFEAAEAEILRMAGTQFDPVAVQAFVAEAQTLRNMVKVKCEEAIAQRDT